MYVNMPHMTDEKLLPKETQTHSAQSTATADTRPSIYSSILAIVGFVILIVIILWGFFHIISLASPLFGSLFNSKKPASIQVTAPQSVTSGDSFAVSWKHSTKKDTGTYAFLYQCNNTLHFEIVRAEGASNSIPCGATFAVPSPTDKVITVTPRLSGTASTSIPLSIVFLPSATTSKQAQGSATVAVLPSVAKPQPVLTPAPAKPAQVKPTPVAQPRATPADLSVRILGASVDQYGMAIVEFDIANNGGSPTGAYYFQAFLPTQSTYTYQSPLQSSLGAGDHIVNTIRFTQAISGTVSIVVDPSSAIYESNENNNYASQSIFGSAYNYNQYNQQPYPYYPYAY